MIATPARADAIVSTITGFDEPRGVAVLPDGTAAYVVNRHVTSAAPATNQAAGLSDAHAPLDSELGTSVVSWHVQYGARCPGTLNPILKLPVGSTCTATDARTPDKPQVYEISKKFATPRGLYLPSWFSQSGPHRLALFTCADRAGREFRKTVAIFAASRAEPVGVDQPTG